MHQRFVLVLAALGLLTTFGCSGSECVTTADCGAGQTCDAEKCVPLPAPTCSPACSGDTPICDEATGECLTCTLDEGCASSQVCDVAAEGGACVECVDDAHCAAAKPVCDQGAHACVTCTASRGCSNGQTCDTSVAGGVCTGCLSDEECPAQTPVCDSASLACVVCTANRGCPAGQTCDSTEGLGRCTGCASDADCSGTTPICDEAAGQCFACTETEGCSGATPFCSTSAPDHACVACLENAHCTADPARPFCAAGRCESTDPAAVSAEIAAVRAAADGEGLALPITGAVVTYVRPAVSEDPAGFFLQAERTGPAIFVAVDPTGLSPSPTVGSRVELTVTAITTVSELRQVTAIDGLQVTETDVPVGPLLQEVSTATDLVTALDDYESELVAVSGALGAFTDAGVGHVAARLKTAGLDNTNLKLRVPETLQAELDLAEGCSVTLGAGPMWRHNSTAQPLALSSTDFASITCSAPSVIAAFSTSLEQVIVSFDRRIDPASVLAAGGQFTFDNGLTATAAVVDGKDVVVSTSPQTPEADYTVTAAATVLDTRGSPVNPAANSAQFTALYPQARLQITEVNPNIPTSRDLVEFVVVEPGTTKQLTIVQEASDPQTLVTFPDVVMAVGDLIVLHLNPGADSPSSSERLSKTESTATGAFPGAWDFIGGSAGVTFSHRILMVKTPAGEIQDAVVFIKSDLEGTAPAGFPVAIEGIQTLGEWSPSNCGGAPCTYESTPSVLDIAVDWKDAGNTRDSSFSRIPGQDTNSKDDWLFNLDTATFGAPNPAP